MKFLLAQNSGFCFGVEKAIQMAFETLDCSEPYNEQNKKKIFSLGPLIHNDQVVSKLQEKGLIIIENLDEAFNGTIIIRSHGVSEHIYEIAKKKKLKIIDTTCPFVKRIQMIAKKYYTNGYTVIIVGDPYHPEVVGINGWCNNDAFIVQSRKDIENINFSDKMCVVSQTTMAMEKYHELIEILEKRFPKIEKFNTICLATKERQTAAEELAKQVDAMIVIGGYHSSNSQKLVSVCKNIKPNSTFHIEIVEDLQVDELIKYENVGITAGASTPQWIIGEVIEFVSKI